MNNKVDDLFKEKLVGHDLPPSPQAWSKLESHLAKKNNTVWILRAAAVIALFGALTFVIMNQVGSKEKQSLTKKKDVQPEVKKPAVADASPAKASIEKIESIEKKSSVQPRPLRKHQVIEKAEVEAVAEKANKEVTDLMVNNTLENTVAEVIPEEKNETTESPVVAEKRMVLVYTLPAVAKKKVEPVMEEAEEKQNGFQKVLSVAKDVKNSDHPMAELREAKDDLFAFDFRKVNDKNKKQ